MRKAPEAFRTISEAAEALDTPAHVLRFWESKFTQVKPVKRAGGRRYYRPGDIDLLSGIRTLLHDQGMTIRGVQKLLREKGARHVAALAPMSGDMANGTDAPVLRVVQDIPKVATQDGEDAVPEPAVLHATQEPTTSEGLTEIPDLAEASDPDANVPEATEKPQSPARRPSTVQQSPDDAAREEMPQSAPALAERPSAAAVDHPATTLRFAMIAHALRTNPPKSALAHASALSRLEALVEKLTARAD